MKFVVISGLSGAGKSTAMHALEEAGFFLSDNLPPHLWLSFYQEAINRGLDKIGISVDARTSAFFGNLEEQLLLLAPTSARLVFLEASDEVLLTRYNFTRRSHPLGEISLLLDFRRERELLAPLRAQADVVIDTSELSNRALRLQLLERLHLEQEFTLSLSSFGFKYGPPRDADMILDMRGLPNPYYDLELRHKTGLNPEVAQHVFSPEGRVFYQKVLDLVEMSANLAYQSGRRSYSVAIGCTGGRHRSVAVSEALNRDLQALGAKLSYHRDIEKGE